MNINKATFQWLGLLIILALWLPNIGQAAPNAQQTIKAFPGAEGYGTDTTHGRGGRVIYVTNLNDDGAGSLRDAVEAEGPRIVMFRVSGTIRLKDFLRVRNPYIYIAGQTAPGDGIAVEGAGFAIHTHDVLIRYMRMRPGDSRDGSSPQSRDAITVSESGIYNVVIDHNSFSWGVDENASMWSEVSNITYSWNIISEGLRYSIHPKGKHSMGMLIGRQVDNVSIHHNLYAHNNERNPLIAPGSRSDIVNNVMYNWGTNGTTSSDADNTGLPIYANLVGNYYKIGPDSKPWEFMIRDAGYAPDPRSKYYLSGNIGPNRPSNDMDDWAISRFEERTYRTNTPHEAAPVTIWSAEESYERVLEFAGATYPKRDAVDRRIVEDVRNGTGRIIDRVSETPGFPVLRSATAPQDTDGDGMPDIWEQERGLDPNDISDGAQDRNDDGYTNIEEYIIGLTNDSFVPPEIPQIEEPGNLTDEDAAIEIEEPGNDVAPINVDNTDDNSDDEEIVSDKVLEEEQLPTVTGFVLVDANTDRDIRSLNNNDTLDLTQLPNRLTIRAEASGNVGSVKFQYLGRSNYQTESVAPYALNGDNQGNYSAADFPVGTQTVIATPYTESGASGDTGTSLSISFVITEGTQVVDNTVPQEPEEPTAPITETDDTPAVTRFILVDARSNEDIRTLDDGDTLNLSELPDRLTIRAEVSGDVGSVKFRFKGDSNYRTENAAPYALNGDREGNYSRVRFSTGQNLLGATPYTEEDRKGDQGEALTIRFTVTDDTRVVINEPIDETETNTGNDLPRVTGLMLVNAATDSDIRPLRNGDTLNLASLPDQITIRATASNNAASVVFGYQDKNRYQTENTAPYTVNGDTNGNYRPMQFDMGQNTIKVTAYTRAGGRGTASDTLTVRFTVRDAAPQIINNEESNNTDDLPTVSSLVLVDARTDQDIRFLNNGDAIILSQLPPQLTIRANVSGNVGSVVFNYRDNPTYQTENDAPYALNGDDSGNMRPVDFSLGQMVLMATPYTEENGQGNAGQPMIMGLVVIDNPQTEAPAAPVTVAEAPTEPPPLAVTVVNEPEPVQVNNSSSTVDSGGSSSNNNTQSTNTTNNNSSSGSSNNNTQNSGNSNNNNNNSGELRINNVVLIDANTGRDIAPVTEGATLPLSQVPDELNFRANVSGPVESVVFNFTANPSSQTEEDAPYTLAGNNENGYHSVRGLKPGSTHTITVTAYSESNGKGRASATYRVSFNVSK